MEENSEDKFHEEIRNQCCKRMLSTEDPDYTRPPDPKRMKEMEERAQDELRDRVIKVVDGVLSSAANEKQSEMEEIDARILRVQQCLHTLRYCVSLNYHTVDKLVSSVSNDKQIYEAHPAVRKHMGKAPVHTATPGSSDLSSLDSSTPSQIAPNTCRKDDISDHGRLQFNEESSSKGKLKREISEFSSHSESIKKPNTLVCTGANDKSSLLRNEDKTHETSGINLELSRPPSPKYLPPKPPDSQIIAQGRHQKFQSKRRIVVGNTYQYLTPQTGRDAEDAMRYKWQIYVRVPPQENSIDSFVSDVTFILDKSYAPHHIITLKHPPFVLSRRGWGEFKVQIVLNFNDTRNKKVQFLHPLVLCRPDDPLALTGLWRLGQENWYDVWVYEGSSGKDSKEISEELSLEDEESPAKLEKELQSGTISSQVNQNITICHDGETLPDVTNASAKIVKEENAISDKHLSVKNCKRTINDVDNSVFVKIPVSEKADVTDNDSQNKYDNTKVESKCKLVPSVGINDNKVKSKSVNPDSDAVPVEKETSPTKPSVSNGTQNKMCKIHVRQPDGKLVPYFIPAHMYSLAVKIANMKSSDTSKSSSETSGVEGGGAKSSQKSEGAVNQLLQTASGSFSKTVSLLTVPESGTKKNGSDMAGRSVKDETPMKNVVTYTSMLAASEVKDPPLKKKDDGDARNSKSTPVKILNFSHKNLTEVGPLTDGGSSVSNVQNPTNAVQSKPILMKSGNLSQSALLQLLSKVGIKDGNNAKQQLLLKTGIKGVNLASLQRAQAQLIAAKATQGAKCNIHLMPVKILQDNQKAKSQDGALSNAPLSARLSSQSVQPANLKLVTNDGQMIRTENLPKGTIISSSTKGNTASKSVPMKNTIFTVRTSDLKGMTGNLKDRTSIMMQDGRILAKLSTEVQGVSSQGSAITSKINLVQCSSSKGKGSQVHVSPLVIGRANDKDAENLQTLTLASPVKAIKSENDQMPVTSVTVLAKDSLVSPLAKAKTQAFDPKAVASVSCKIVKNLHSGFPSVLPLKSEPGANSVYLEDCDRLNEVTNNTLEEQNLTDQDFWEEKTRELVAISKSCSSVERCVSLWVRALPLVSSSGSTRSLFPYRATSSENFLKWPFGKQRASEFQRSREVRRWLDMCEVPGRKTWTVRRIVGWARRYGYTPIPYREMLLTDGIVRRDSHRRPDTTLSCLSNLESFTEGASHLWLRSRDSGTQDIDITTADDTLKGRKKNILASPSKSASEIIPWTDPDTVSGCEWVGRRSSELRINLPVEEILPGYRADAGRAVAWQAALSFMEDLLRSSYCQAWEDKSSDPNVVPPKSITISHVRDALLNTRPEFDLFTNEGLGAVTDDLKTT